MDKKDFIFPGVILGLVIITALGLLLTHTGTTPLIPNNGAATTTVDTVASSSLQATPDLSEVPHVITLPTAYYPYGSATLALNQAAMFKDGASMRPLAIEEDSRCPEGVQCIQAGTVKLSLKLHTNGATRMTTIKIGESTTVGADRITFESVSPAHPKDGALSPSAYRFTFMVERAQ